jgi:hypothetical protein
MFRKTLLVCTVALPLGLIGMVSSATARDVDIHFRVPFHSHQLGPRDRYYQDYRWHDAHRYPRFRGAYYDYDDDDDEYVAARFGRLSCGEARRLVREHGFHDVEARNCEGRNYAFSGFRNGQFAIVHVNSRTGVVWRS